MRLHAPGFTLLEVLIALAIVSIGLTAALRAGGVGTDEVREYRAHQLALWVAENVAAERTARGDWPGPGGSDDETEMGGRKFLIHQEIKTTPNPLFLRLEISVASREEPGHSLRRLVTFLNAPR